MNVKVGAGIENKSTALLHYVISKCTDPTKLGATKLNKILYFCDFLFFMQTGKTITTETYVKQDFGPVPKNVLANLKTLEKSGAISISDVPYFSKMKREYLSLQTPSVDQFSAEEIAHINKIVEQICDNFSASDISELTHNLVWECAKYNEEIPPYTIFVPNFEKPSDKDIARAKGIIKNRRNIVKAV